MLTRANKSGMAHHVCAKAATCQQVLAPLDSSGAQLGRFIDVEELPSLENALLD